SHGRAFFEAGWGRKVLPPEVLASLQEAYTRWGTAGVFLSRFLPAPRAGRAGLLWSRFLPGLRAAVPPFAGIAGLDARHALVPAAIASLIWYAFLAWAGYSLVD